MDTLARSRPHDVVVDEHDACWSAGLLFHRRGRWNILDAESRAALVEDEPTFAVPVSFVDGCEPFRSWSERPVLVRGTWRQDGIRADVPPVTWASRRSTGGRRAAGWRPMTHEAALALVELQTAGVVTGVADPSTTDDRRRVYVTDLGRVSEVAELFSPEPVTICLSPWSASEWLDAGATVDQLQHLAGFGDDVEEDAPRLLLWMTRVDPHDAALLERLPDGIVRLRQVLVQPMSTWPG